MIKTFAIALVCVASVVSMAQAQTSGSAAGGASVGSGRTGNGPALPSNGSSVVTPPASTGVGVSGGASGSTSQPTQPSIDTNQAQQPGIGANHR
jgi:hypothetical protein